MTRFLEWFAKADVPSTLYVSAQRQEAREEVLTLLTDTARSIANERIREKVTIAATAYQALDASLGTSDFDYMLILQNIWTCVYHLAVADYYLYMALEEKRIPSGKVSSNDLESYLSSLEAYREFFIDYGFLHHYYQSSLREILPESIQEPLQRFHRVVASLTDVLVSRVESMSAMGTRIPILRVGTVEALANELKHELYPERIDSRYTYIYRADVALDKFPPTIAWSHKDRIFCISYVRRDLLEELGILSFEAQRVWWLPPEIERQISINGFGKSHPESRLYFGNIYEFANAISRLSMGGFLALQVHRPDETLVYGISRRAGAFEISIEDNDPQYGTVFTPLYTSKPRVMLPIQAEPESIAVEPGREGEQPRKLIAEKKIKAGQSATADAAIEEWLKRFQGEVIGEMMFIDKTTFKYLDEIPRGCGIRLAVGHIDDRATCLAFAEKQAVGRPLLEITQIEYPSPDPKHPRTIHERWLADKEIEIDFGVDLKFNAIGKSEHTIHVFEMSPDSERRRQFEFMMNSEKVDLKREFGIGTRRETFFKSAV